MKRFADGRAVPARPALVTRAFLGSERIGEAVYTPLGMTGYPAKADGNGSLDRAALFPWESAIAERTVLRRPDDVVSTGISGVSTGFHIARITKPTPTLPKPAGLLETLVNARRCAGATSMPERQPYSIPQSAPLDWHRSRNLHTENDDRLP